MRSARLLICMIAALGLIGAASARPAMWRWVLPTGVKAPVVPADNRMTAAKIELGRRLFYDADLSIDGTMACATCHEQRHAFADGNATHPGVHGDSGKRNVPGLANVGWAPTLTWADPRVTRLEAQALIPLLGTDPIEMGMAGKEAELARRLSADACYRRQFRTAFPERGGRIDTQNVARALAAFQRSFVSYDSPYDRSIKGRAALPDSARRGAALFNGAAGCAACHNGPNFSDGNFHAVAPADDRDHGLASSTGKQTDLGKFKTPGLRNVALTAPYFHNGSIPTIALAIRLHPRSAELSAAQVDDLGEFLGSLTDESFVRNPALMLPDQACGKRL